MKPLKSTTWLCTGLCLSTSFLLAGCPDTKLPAPPPNVPKPKATLFEPATPVVAGHGVVAGLRA